jgi:hypothetical protein
VIAVNETPNDRLNYTVRHKQIETRPSNPSLRRGLAWAIYPETPDCLWVYDGAGEVTRVVFDAKGGVTFTSSKIVPELLKQVPPAMTPYLSRDNRHAQLEL